MSFQLVMIVWCDAFSAPGWMTPDEAVAHVEATDWEVTEVGWILKETKEYILIAGQWNGQMFGNFTKIPKTWIRKRAPLKPRGK